MARKTFATPVEETIQNAFKAAEYQFHKACCETSEMWMKAIGISPKCKFITERI